MASSSSSSNRERSTNRISHACEACRRRKTKCDGQRPTCWNCQRFLLPCRYADGKRESTRKKVQYLEEINREYEQLLLRIRDRLDENTRADVEDTVAAIGDLGASPQQNVPESDDSLSDEEALSDTMDSLTNEINSLGINQPSGFMGKSAEVSWLKLLRHELGLNEKMENRALQDLRRAKGDYAGPGVDADMVGATYHLDDIDLSLSGTDVRIDLFEIPAKDMADSLVTAYEDTVHQLLPIISWSELRHQYDMLYSTNDPSEIDQYWLMILNLVFACGARFFESMGKDPGLKHVDCFKRARVLGALDGGTLFKIPTLQDVQALALMGMYLLGSKHTNRAWNVIGLALRLGHGLGLHLRIVDPHADTNLAGLRVRVWYSLIYLESTCSLITGRPSILPQHYTGPVPESHEGSPEYYYSALLKLASIITTCQTRLFSRAISNSRQNRIKLRNTSTALNSRLLRWKSRIHELLDFEKDHPGKYLVRQRTDLCLRHYNAQALIFFSSLVYSEQIGQSNECLCAARGIISLVLTHINQDKVELLPWWCLLHYIVTAEVVFMLAILRAETVEMCQELFEMACEPMHWLQEVGKFDLAAQRSNSQLRRLLEHVKLAVRKQRGYKIDYDQLDTLEILLS